MTRRASWTGWLAPALALGIACVPGLSDAQPARRYVVQARAGEVTVDLPVQRRSRSGRQTPTRLPDTDWSCLAFVLDASSLGISCTTADGHSLTTSVDGCGPLTFSLGSPQAAGPTYHVRANCSE